MDHKEYDGLTYGEYGGNLELYKKFSLTGQNQASRIRHSAQSQEPDGFMEKIRSETLYAERRGKW